MLCFTHYRQYSSNVTAERTFNGSRQNQNTRIRKTYFLQFLGLVTTWDTFWVPYKGKSQIPYRAWISRNKLKSKLRLNSEYLIFFLKSEKTQIFEFLGTPPPHYFFTGNFFLIWVWHEVNFKLKKSCYIDIPLKAMCNLVSRLVNSCDNLLFLAFPIIIK